jgi:hypothetical protein
MTFTTDTFGRASTRAGRTEPGRAQPNPAEPGRTSRTRPGPPPQPPAHATVAADPSVDEIGIFARSLARFEGGDAGEVFVIENEVENVEVLGDA